MKRRHRKKSFTYDADAAAYIAAVESADGQLLPQTWKNLITQFVIGCKIDQSPNAGVSNWDAMKSANIIAGASTLAGALVPLKGIAPTNNNFTSADYNPYMGLKGGLNKTLAANRANNADQQNNSHQSIFGSSLPIPGAATGVIGCVSTAPGTTAITELAVTGNIAVRSRTVGGAPVNLDAGQNLITGGFAAISRNSAGSYDWRVKGVSANVVEASNATDATGNFIFSVINTSIDHPKRISWYSIGEAVDMALLEARVNSLMAGLNMLDSDTQIWVRNVDAAGGALSNLWISAVNDFVVGTKADGTWPKMADIGLLAGGNDLTAATVKLKAFAGSPASFTNNNFVSGDYTPTGTSAGLKGDGTSKYFNVGWNPGLLTAASSHLGVYNTVAASTGNRIAAGAYVAGNNTFFVRTSQNGDNSDFSLGVLGGGNNGSRIGYSLGSNDSGNLTGYVNGVPVSATSSAGALPLLNMYIGANNVANAASNIYNGRLTFYHAGTGLTASDASMLSTRINTLMASIGANTY